MRLSVERKIDCQINGKMSESGFGNKSQTQFHFFFKTVTKHKHGRTKSIKITKFEKFPKKSHKNLEKPPFF